MEKLREAAGKFQITKHGLIVMSTLLTVRLFRMQAGAHDGKTDDSCRNGQDGRTRESQGLQQGPASEVGQPGLSVGKARAQSGIPGHEEARRGQEPSRPCENLTWVSSDNWRAVARTTSSEKRQAK
jgi:hypothetical protein